MNGQRRKVKNGPKDAQTEEDVQGATQVHLFESRSNENSQNVKYKSLATLIRSHIDQLLPVIQRVVCLSTRLSNLVILKYMSTPDKFNAVTIDKEFFLTSLMSCFSGVTKEERLWRDSFNDFTSHYRVEVPETTPSYKLLMWYLLHLVAKQQTTNCLNHMDKYSAVVERRIEFLVRRLFGDKIEINEDCDQESDIDLGQKTMSVYRMSGIVMNFLIGKSHIMLIIL